MSEKIRTECPTCKQNTFYNFVDTQDEKIAGCFNEECPTFNGDLYSVNIKEEFELILLRKLGFCGCGRPDDVIIFIRKFIELTILRHDIPISVYDPGYRGEYKKYSDRITQLIIDESENVEWIIYYLLDHKGIFTHGGNVSGGWIDDHYFKEMLDIYVEDFCSQEN